MIIKKLFICNKKDYCSPKKNYWFS